MLLTQACINEYKLVVSSRSACYNNRLCDFLYAKFNTSIQKKTTIGKFVVAGVDKRIVCKSNTGLDIVERATLSEKENDFDL